MSLFVFRTWLEAKFGKDEEGASMVEYILLVALIALAIIAAVVFLKDQVNGKFNQAGKPLGEGRLLSNGNQQACFSADHREKAPQPARGLLRAV